MFIREPALHIKSCTLQVYDSISFINLTDVDALPLVTTLDLIENDCYKP
jgi:hypothetical protein